MLNATERNKKIPQTLLFAVKFKSARRDSNPRPRPWQGRAPPTEPLAQIMLASSADLLILLYHLVYVNTIFAKKAKKILFTIFV